MPVVLRALENGGGGHWAGVVLPLPLWAVAGPKAGRTATVAVAAAGSLGIHLGCWAG